MRNTLGRRKSRLDGNNNGSRPSKSSSPAGDSNGGGVRDRNGSVGSLERQFNNSVALTSTGSLPASAFTVMADRSATFGDEYSAPPLFHGANAAGVINQSLGTNFTSYDETWGPAGMTTDLRLNDSQVFRVCVAMIHGLRVGHVCVLWMIASK